MSRRPSLRYRAVSAAQTAAWKASRLAVYLGEQWSKQVNQRLFRLYMRLDTYRSTLP